MSISGQTTRADNTARRVDRERERKRVVFRERERERDALIGNKRICNGGTYQDIEKKTIEIGLNLPAGALTVTFLT